MQQQTLPVTPNKPPARRRSLFLPGFVLGFLLLTVLSCGGALYAAGIEPGKIAELRGQGATAWSPPPTPASLPAAEAPAPVVALTGEYAFRSGDRPYNITSSLVNLRATPGYLGKTSDDLLAQAVPGQQVEIIDGPRFSDGLTWWHVRLLPAGEFAEGWMAEATGSGVQILGN